MFGLKGKVAVVTGAAGQLGGEYVKALLAAGAVVAGLDIDPDNPQSRLQDICQDNFMVLKADITRKNELAAALKKIVLRLGNPQILVNNAAIDAPPDGAAVDSGPVETYPEESWDLMMKVNLKGVFFCCQVFGGHMAVHGGGSIINISSIYGMLSPDQRLYEYRDTPFFKPAAYSVSKAGVLNLTRYLATYWAGKKVRVNTLTLAGVFNGQDERFLKKYNDKVPLGRMANASDYNGAVLFLASEASAYMTGANLVIDGGFSAW
jgi:NAD(P)-dependent dehydrogenase (short-subunit alcohol dehydrogenase family)